MNKVSELTFGFRDAENYRRRENKDLFNHIFVRDKALEDLCEKGKYFLVGEKGAGKTAYAVFLCNNNYRDTLASLKYIRETEYQKFLEMKRSKHLVLTDYTNIWRIILYLLLAEQIIDHEGRPSFLAPFKRFGTLRKAVDEYYAHAFSPEIIHAIRFVEESKLAAELLCKHAKVGGEESETVTFTETRFQTNLLYIQKHFEEALAELKLNRNHILFIDGIDIRPASVPYADYLECVKGLANAVWSLNNDFLANIRDSKGRMKVVLLIRPDILDSLDLQNTNSKVRDNSVILNWLTTYPEHRRSHLFAVTDRVLGVQQSRFLEIGQAWDHYFPFDASNVIARFDSCSSFIAILRYSLYRPRDILTILTILKENLITERRAERDVFAEKDLRSPAFTREYSDYLLGEVKDHLSFRYQAQAYELLLKFFQFLNGRYRFTYEEFLVAYSAFDDFICSGRHSRPVFCESADGFLQFLYELNVVGYIVETDETPFFGFCFRERTPSNLSPKVRTHVRYEITYGLRKALDLGKHFRVDSSGIT